MLEFLRKRVDAVRYALQGWAYVLRTQRNAWIHGLFSIAVFLMSWWLELDRVEWALIFLTVALVWMAEMVNTALEAIVDLASPQEHPLAKVGKDVGAASVLIGALAAVIVGLLVLGPPLLAKLGL